MESHTRINECVGIEFPGRGTILRAIASISGHETVAAGRTRISTSPKIADERAIAELRKSRGAEDQNEHSDRFLHSSSILRDESVKRTTVDFETINLSSRTGALTLMTGLADAAPSRHADTGIHPLYDNSNFSC